MKKISFKIILLVLNIYLSFSIIAQDDISTLESSFSGELNWEPLNGVIEFTSSGEFNFNKDEFRFFIWDVPNYVKKIIIGENITVTGAFHTYSNCEIIGENRETSIVYGTPEQRWADNRELDEWHYCQFQAFGGTLYIKNLTSLNPFSYHVRGWGNPVHAKKVNFIDDREGSQNHSDGFTGGDGSTVDSCYFETGDDVIKVYFDITVTNSVIKMVQNSVPIQFGWGNYGSGAVGYFENVTIFGNSGRGPDNRIISARAGQYDKKIILKNCSIDNPTSALLSFYEEGQFVDIMIANTPIKINNFMSQKNGDAIIYINGEYYNKNSTRNLWDLEGQSDTTAPDVSMELFQHIFARGDSLYVTADVSDSNNIYAAELMVNEGVVDIDREPPFEFKIEANFVGTNQISVRAIDEYYNIGRSNEKEVTVNFFASQNAYPSQIPIIPGRLEAEEFDDGGLGIAYYVLDSTRREGNLEYRIDDSPNVEFTDNAAFSNGMSLRSVKAYEWFEYTVDISATSYYPIIIGYSSTLDSNVIRVRKDLNILKKVTLPKTSDTGTWITAEVDPGLFMNKGKAVFRIEVLEGEIGLDFIHIGIPTDVEEEMIKLNNFELQNNYPNPFNPKTTISYSIPTSGRVKLSIYDSLGREIKRLVDNFQSAGRYSVDFNVDGLTSGVYYYSLKTDKLVKTKKMAILK